MFSFSIPSSPERIAVATQLLKLLSIFGLVVTVFDYLNGNYIIAACAAIISLSAPIILHLSREARYATLPLKFGTGLLICMYLVGTFTQLPHYPDKAVWVSVFPFAYFYVTGLRAGSVLSILSVLLMPLSYMIYPLFSSASRISPYSLSQSIGAFLLCSVLAYKYEQIRSQQEILLKHSAECDPLTGLLNRRGFTAVSDSAVQHAVRFQQPFAVVMIDLDDFKRVNDTQGHGAGDQLLKDVAAMLQMHTRRTDIVARWGGEEFVLLLAQSNLEGARRISEIIRAAIASQQFSSGQHTASLGIAIHVRQETLTETIQRADKAMYHAKQTGKNRVEYFDLQLA